MKLTFPYIPLGSNQIHRMHYQEVSKLRAQVHQDMLLLLPPNKLPFPRAILTLDFRWRTGTKRDPLNYVAGGMKGGIDALVGRWIVDDDATHLEAIVRGQVGTGERDHIIVTVEDTDA